MHMTETITARWEGTAYTEIPKGTLLQDLAPKDRKHRILAAEVNGILTELDQPLFESAEITWLDDHCEQGWRVYKRSMIFLLIVSAKEEFPDLDLYVSHSLSEGIFCRFQNGRCTKEMAERLTGRMRFHMENALPFTRLHVSKEEAANYFRSHGNEDKAALMEKGPDRTTLYQAGPIMDNLLGPMVPDAGYLDFFLVLSYEDGIWLKLPARKYLGCGKADRVPVTRLQRAMRDFDEWSRLMGIETVGDLNRVVKAGPEKFNDLVQVSETFYERHIRDIADTVKLDFPTARLILLAGPSSSGKTTSSERLGIQFKTLGIQIVRISMDDYFKSRELTPLLPNGKPDFESLRAMDLDLFQDNMSSLLAGKLTRLPRYDFVEGRSIPEARELRLREDQILIVEGIHAMNPVLTEHLPAESIRRMFVSALTQLNYDRYSPVSASDCRMIRRMARDMQFRGVEPRNTLLHWNEVRKGEHMNIFPWQDLADFFLNSSLLYEMAVLRPMVETSLAAIPFGDETYASAQKALALIRCFEPTGTELVPRNSILQEFLGNSVFKV